VAYVEWLIYKSSIFIRLNKNSNSQWINWCL